MSGPYANHALTYWRGGLRGILPLPPGCKKDPPAGYTGQAGAWPSRADIQTWIDFRGDGNLALRLPGDGLGLDVDAYDGKCGAETLARCEAELGPLPPTILVTARDDGISGIRIFRAPERPSWSDPGNGLEVIHRGWRYIVAPPSIHPNGTTYKWVDQRTGEVLDALPDLASLPGLPPAWVQRLSSDRQPADKASADNAEVVEWLQGLPDGPPCDKTADALRRFHETLTSGGSRHDATLKPVGALVRAGERGHRGVPAALSEARAAFIAAVTVPGDNQRTEREAVAEWRRGVAGAYQIVKADPSKTTGCYCDGPTQVDVPENLAALQAPTDGDPYPPLDWHALWNSDADAIDWIIDDLIEAGRAAAIFAPGKTGKSLLMLEAAGCVATGRAFAGQKVAKPRTVLYVDWENSPGDVLARLKTLGFRPHELDRLIYLSLPMLPPLDTDAGGQALTGVAHRHTAELVVLDTVARATDGPENDADTFRDYYRHTGQRLKAAGVAVWRIDHAGMDLSRGQRGSSAKNDDVDAVWKLTAHGRGRLALKLERRRTLHGLEELHVTRGDDGRLHAADRDRPDYTDQLDVIVKALDDSDIPLDWGRRRAGPALREAGVTARNELIGAAITLRRERARRVPDTGPRDDLRGHVRGHVQVVPEMVPETGPQAAGTRGDTPGPVTGGVTGPHQPHPSRDAVGTGPPHPADGQDHTTEGSAA